MGRGRSRGVGMHMRMRMGDRLRPTRAPLLALALAAVAVFATGIAQAGPPGGGGGSRGHGHGIERVERKVPRLGLAPDTEKAVYAALDEARATRRALERDAHAAHERLRSLLDQDRPPLEEVLAQADALGALQTEIRKADLRAMVAVRTLLSPQQWETFRARRHERPRGGDAAEGP